MNLTANKEQFEQNLHLFEPKSHPRERSLALFAASITFGDELLLEKSFVKLNKQLEQKDFYETILQSYLFLGFPRMLSAAISYGRFFKIEGDDFEIESKFVKDISDWVERGERLCRKIYKEKYQPLRQLIAPLAPEVFEWMISEGYGKVLSRNQLNIQTRELCIVSTLTMENRPSQLMAHMRGAVNVEVDNTLLKEVIEDLKESAGDGYKNALEIYKKVTK